jgi:acetoin utilization protein AcuB
MLVRHFMAVDPFTLAPDQTCQAALAAFNARRIRRAPVVENNRLVGIVSERDLLHILPGTCAQASTQAGEDSMALAVRHVMRTEVVTVAPSEHLARAASLMLKNRIGGLPVVHDGRLKGIITESDIFKALYAILTPSAGVTIVFEELAQAASAEVDYARLCIKHQLRIHSLLRYPKPGGGAMYYLCVDGKDADAFTRELWARSNQVVFVEKR